MIPTRRNFLNRLGAASLICLLPPFGARAEPPRPRTVTIRIAKRRMVSPTGAIRLTQGDTVVLRWISDETVKLHIHGYDREFVLRPGAPGLITFNARAAGRFPVTSHGWGAHGHGHSALTYIEVYPK